MPTKNPRIALTLQPHRYDLLKRMAALQGATMSSVISDVLEELYPVMERVCVALEMAKQAQESSKQGLRESVDRSLGELLPIITASQAQMDIFLGTVEAAAKEAVGGVAAEAAAPPAASSDAGAAALNPRVVTRGSGFAGHIPRRPSTTPSKAGRKGVSKK